MGDNLMLDMSDLAGQFLVALPDMNDPRFQRAVIYICSHNEDGAMGLVINKAKSKLPEGPLRLSTMLAQIGIEGDIKVADSPVLEGGPVDIERGFVLHSADYFRPSMSLRLSETLCLTSTKDILEALTSDDAPDMALLAIGYAGWEGGQIEREIQANVWMVVPGNEALIFDDNLDNKWASALAEIGVTPDMLAHAGGRA